MTKITSETIGEDVRVMQPLFQGKAWIGCAVRRKARRT